MDFTVQTQQQPPARPIPADAASSSANPLKARRRTSLPSSVQTTDSRPKKRTPNYIRTQAASPQVISSLIDQLSAISIPAHNHFENLLVGYDSGLSAPTSPSIHTQSGRNSLAGQDAASVDQTAYYNSIRGQNDLYPDDACEPPVIRTSKPPSGLSPLTAPKKRDKPHSLSSYIGRSAGSSASIHSAHSNRSASSFGNISIEAAPPKKLSIDSTRSSVESKRSAKGHRSLMYMSSRERLKQKETERKRATIHTLEDITSPDSPRKSASQLFPYEDTIKEEPFVKEEEQEPATESSRFAQRYPSRNTSPRRIRLNLVDGPNGESPSDKGLIPERGSSLKHTGSPTRKSKKGHADEKSRQKSRKTNMVPEEDKKLVQESAMKQKILKELEHEESEVAQRIRELKEQKMRRDKLAGKMPVDDVDAGATPPSVPRVSSLPNPDPSPASSVSSASEIRVQDLTKAHKVLGISVQPASSEKRTEKLPEKYEDRESEHTATPQTRSMRHSRHRSLTVNDGEDFAPLPINYALALQSLEESAPLSPLEPPGAKNLLSSSVSIASTVGTKSSSDTAAPRRASSFVVGGRSAVGRRAAPSSATMSNTGNATGHKHSSSVTDSAISRMSPTSRSASEEVALRHQSLQVPSPSASNSLQLQRRRTLTKKRWSHPDLPAKAEKEHNIKMEKSEAKMAAAAVQSLPYPVIEERPVSLDSIDIDVQSYLNSPRLSQKIRHPQTGRIISFSEVGDPDGYAVFVCVGMGLTRYVMAFYDQLAATLKLRLITPDRPGIGESQVDPNGTPLSWPDDVLVICQALKISKFSLLAHSAGAVYALATSLRMPQHIRGRVHLLAPWIPPSQMAPIGISQDSPPTQQLPRSQRFLRALPPSLLKVANSTFLSATSASLQRTGPKSSPKTRRKSMAPQTVPSPQSRPPLKDSRPDSMLLMDQVLPNASSLTLTSPADPNYEQTKRMQEALSLAERERQHAFDERLTFAIWDRATTNANPATDLIVCLETKQSIGFRYEDINRPVVIHHGSKDSRVPADNVRWLGRLMRKCEVRILEGEHHGLMASAQVMGNVLTEMASDWEEWTSMTSQKPPTADQRTVSRRRTTEKLRSQLSFSA
ncbi:alpha/beta-hydrolase [Cucurbitaria berberidis CBS 394.84]|uniref:Alpha/beta-hydrolase n=1 Tax=Cucurbitaria berberidis CBS 394.84 TaxID=1168544 RepID=A0A9P4GJ84_9PLEO|nr:alpha/beta-hydrolase [Cucurbitaria berberidis CBS 394.84]KAF1846600.1 alpha/beta-hydrolase [Cucurbitaria berberidis CBS 394.84]